MRGMTIGQLARAAGVGVETIRYYQRRALIPVPPRPLGAVRRYPEETLARLAFIRRAQEVGFTLEEISALLDLSTSDCETGYGLAKAKHAELGERIEALTRMRSRLAGYIERPPARVDGLCPFLSALNGVAE
jgi:MerR family mercuric resistance operon transcriptional regulator